MWPKEIFSLLKETVKEWSEDNASRLAASLSYYAIFSLAPLLIIAIAIAGFFRNLLPGTEILWQIVDGVASFAIITLLFAIMFKVLPDARIKWGDVWIGAAVTALLFTIGKFVIGFYLGNRSVSSAYGAAGSLVAILLWIYYSAQIFFFGAEFTQVYVRRYGPRIRPGKRAISLYEERRVQKRIPREVEFRMRRGERSRAHEKIAQQDSGEQSTSLAPKKRASLGYAIGFGAFIGLYLEPFARQALI